MLEVSAIAAVIKITLKNIQKKVMSASEMDPVKLVSVTQAHLIHKYIGIKVKVLKF
jgi:hypothetical protein